MGSSSNSSADILLVSNAIFTGLSNEPEAGFLAVRGNKILAIGPVEDKDMWIGPKTKVYSFHDQLIMPGVHDNHVFFTGYMSLHYGVDLSETSSPEEAAELLLHAAKELPEGKNVYAFGWDAEAWGGSPNSKLLDDMFPDRPVTAINRSKSECWMNQLATERYKFTPKECSAEARALLLREMLSDPEAVESAFLSFCDEMAKRGVTSIKDIQFDDSYGLLAVLQQLEREERLPLRVHFALEPVLEPLNTKFGAECKRIYPGDHLRYQGCKLMVDGVVADHTGDMLEPYADMPGVTGLKSVDYDTLEQTVLEADRHGIKCCLTAEGDAAIRKCVDIYEKCRKQSGSNQLKHSISDLEYPHPDDLRRMGELEIYAEVYAQILLLNPSHHEAYMAACVGKAKESRFHNYRGIVDAAIPLAFGTDLPLFMTSVPDSIYAAHARLFPDGTPEGGWQRDRGLSIAEILKAWTIHGASHCGMEELTGTLEVGKLADIAVFDRNLFTVESSAIRSAEVVLTIANGSVRYDQCSRWS
ncbi:metal-dependent hydrolase [Paenibacillus sp. CAA11]|uniref:amidohydrolase n=1 Tax=Paenibacillus sp. CAA11 TaxID=1532905 RepID=UPI000D3B1A3E|nr:amidohydrolase family protein [Paenibacillus sp. CAA11]AWB44535.1 metal-dependent hydrolase [Paenibacillus sp. CAA11]